jgi:ABC-2 type transport system ATP-binding protein
VIAAIETFDLSKTFAPLVPAPARRPPFLALDGVTVTIPHGQVFGLLGPNGAGKTTLIKILCGLILPTRGTAVVAGFDLVRQASALRARLGLVTSDERSFYWRLTGRQNLEFFAALHDLRGAAGRRRVDELLALVDLTEHAERRFDAYSTGMKQRLAVARGLLHDPDILFLDEPTKGLDPLATQRVHELVRDLIRRGKTVIMATQRLEEAEKLCRRIAFFGRGRVAAEGTPDELRARLADAEQYVLHIAGLDEAALAELGARFPAVRVSQPEAAHTLTLPVTPGGDELSNVLAWLVSRGGCVRDINRTRADLETVFARIVQA